MYFDEKFAKSLPEDPVEAIPKIADHFTQKMSTTQSKPVMLYPVCQEAMAFIQAYSQANGLELKEPPQLNGDPHHDVTQISNYIKGLKGTAMGQIKLDEIARHRGIFDSMFGNVFHYEFSDGDLEKIQALLNELRDLISKTDELKAEHRDRLLRRLEKVQSEFHKRVSDFDRLYGVVIDISLLIGQFGENIKPVTDRIREIMGIVRPSQNRAYELSSSAPLKLLGESENGTDELMHNGAYYRLPPLRSGQRR